MRVLSTFRSDSRGVSFQLGNILALVILTVLLSGVITATGDFVGDTQKDATQEELTITGERIAAELMVADHLMQSGERATITMEPLTPTRISGSQYNIKLESNSSTDAGMLTLTTTSPDVSVKIPFRHDTSIQNTTVASGGVVITSTDAGELTLASQG